MTTPLRKYLSDPAPAGRGVMDGAHTLCSVCHSDDDPNLFRNNFCDHCQDTENEPVPWTELA